MNRHRYFLNFSKEEAWLAQMAEQGWLFTLKTSINSYYFEEGKAGSYLYRIDYRTFRRDVDFIDYVQLFEDSGWHHIAGTMRSGEQYFVKTSSRATDDIFSDNASKAGRYRRIIKPFLLLSLTYLIFGIYFSLKGGFDFAALSNPTTLYITPGLWEKTGPEFLFSFLLETPIVILRSYFALGFFLVFFINIVFVIKAFWLSRKMGRTG